MSQDLYQRFNCYAVLGIPASSSPGDIRLAWTKSSFEHHPDKGGSHDGQVKINLAYEVLSDPVARQAHDIFWKTNPSHSLVKPTNLSRKPFESFSIRLDNTIKEAKSRVWIGLEGHIRENERLYFCELHKIRKSIFWIGAGALICAYFATKTPILWLPSIGCSWWLLSSILASEIGGGKFSIFATNVERKLKEHAKFKATEKCKAEIQAFDKYTSSFASLVELLTRPSSYDDTEEQVARRLTACFFLMGYEASWYDGADRTLLFTDNEEKLLVRFRHRPGNAVNVSYVEKLSVLMEIHKASHGILFCSPGLSGNAATYANKNKIKHYSLESMNNWINKILVSEYDGTAGNILAGLDKLSHFLSKISPRVSHGRHRRRRYRHYR